MMYLDLFSDLYSDIYSKLDKLGRTEQIYATTSTLIFWCYHPARPLIQEPEDEWDRVLRDS